MKQLFSHDDIIRCLRLGGHNVCNGQFVAINNLGLVFHHHSIPSATLSSTILVDEGGDPDSEQNDRNSPHMRKLYGELEDN